MENRLKKEGASALSLPSYEYSPWKDGRTKEEQKKFIELEEIHIPHGVKSLGNYIFYGCRNLKTLGFTDSVTSIGGGAFTGCNALEKLKVEMEEGAASCIKDIVSETFHPIFVEIQFRNSEKRAELIFPEYYEEGVENTPARILETHFHGCGYKYRQCFQEKKIDYRKYDSLFPTAVVYEKEEILIPMAMGRLLYPYELSEENRQNYKKYVKEHLLACGSFYLYTEKWNVVFQWMKNENLWEEETLQQLIQLASQRNRPDAVSSLMNIKQVTFGIKVKTFDL